MAYNPNLDYAAEMKRYLAGGGKETDQQYKAYQTARTEKIYNMTPQQASNLGASKEYNQVQGLKNTMFNTAAAATSLIPYGGNFAASTIRNAGNYLSRPDNIKPNVGGTITPTPTRNYDYSGMINGSYNSLLDSQKAKLRANLQAQLSRYGGMKQQAGQQALGSLNANDASALQSLQGLYNSMEAQGGYKGGGNITGQIQIGAMQGQNANAIRQDRDNYLNSLDTQANTLQSTAADNELALTGEIEAQRLKDLQAARQYADSMDMQNQQFQYGMSQDALNRMDNLTQLGTQNNQWQQTFDADQKWKDYQAKQAEREAQWAQSADNPAVKAQILANQISELELQNLPEQQRLQIQQLKKQIAQIGAVQPISDYEKQMQTVALETAKEKLDQLKNPPASQGDTVNYWISSATKQLDAMPQEARGPWLNSNKSEIIGNVGIDAYNSLKSLYNIY